MINLRLSGHNGAVAQATLMMGQTVPDTSSMEASCASAEQRVAALVRDYYDYVWRVVRRLGIREGDADDAAQQVFMTAARKLDSIRPGCERAFVFQIALRVASTQRRSRNRRREADSSANPEETIFVDRGPSADELVGLRRARAQLDFILDKMPLDARAVFILHELEEETMSDIAAMLDIPPGTAASRLRRARKIFYQYVVDGLLVDGGTL